MWFDNTRDQETKRRLNKSVNGYEDVDRNMFFKLKEGSRTRGHKAALVKEQCRLDMRKYSFSQTVITEWNKLPNDCVNVSSVNMFPCPVCRHLHFLKLNNICHFSDHLTNLSRSFCKCCLSPSLLTLLNTFVSSANFSKLFVILSSKSLIYIKNNKGPNTDPCGTPLKTDFQFETSSSTTTHCLLSVSHCSIWTVNYAISDTMGF